MLNPFNLEEYLRWRATKGKYWFQTRGKNPLKELRSRYGSRRGLRGLAVPRA